MVLGGLPCRGHGLALGSLCFLLPKHWVKTQRAEGAGEWHLAGEWDQVSMAWQLGLAGASIAKHVQARSSTCANALVLVSLQS